MELPCKLEVGPVYGLTALGRNPNSMRLALFMLEENGQVILARHGFLPVVAFGP